MIRLEPEAYHRATRLLDDAPFNVLMARAVLAGKVRGEVYADGYEPTSVYVKHMYGMSWLVGYPEDDELRSRFVETLVDPARRGAPEWLQVYPLDWTELLDPLAADGLLTRWHRTNFWFNRARFLARFPAIQVQARTEPCTPTAVSEFPGSVIPHHFWNSSDEFDASGAGFFAVDGNGRPAAIAFASYLDDRHMEIGVETLPDQRGRGFAQSASARLIHYCIDNDLVPVWSCRTENEGSYRLAEKVGFVPVLEVPYYELPSSPTP